MTPCVLNASCSTISKKKKKRKVWQRMMKVIKGTEQLLYKRSCINFGSTSWRRNGCEWRK